MALFYYSLTAIAFVFISAIYFTRTWWSAHLPSSVVSRLPTIPYIYSSVPPTPVDGTGSFSDDAAAGLHSANFNLAGNIEGGDGRAGLDDAAKREVQRVMKVKRLGFDEARRLVVEERFRKHGIGPDGRPRDPKFVSFS